eukprot:COSAG01_NODE_46602_length_398_cov_6.371237_2_plen_73_part_01
MARRVAEPPGASEELSELSCRDLSSKASSFVFVAPRRSVGLREDFKFTNLQGNSQARGAGSLTGLYAVIHQGW